MCFVSVCLLVIGQSGQITQTNNYKSSYIFSLKLFTCDRTHILYHFRNTSCLCGCDYTHSNNSINENLLSVIHSFCQRLYQFLGEHSLYSRTPLVLEDPACTRGLRFYSRTPLLLEDPTCTWDPRLYNKTPIVLEDSAFIQWFSVYSNTTLVLSDPYCTLLFNDSSCTPWMF